MKVPFSFMLFYCYVHILEKYFYTKQLVNFVFISNFEKCLFIEEILSTVLLNRLFCHQIHFFDVAYTGTVIAYIAAYGIAVLYAPLRVQSEVS